MSMDLQAAASFASNGWRGISIDSFFWLHTVVILVTFLLSMKLNLCPEAIVSKIVHIHGGLAFCHQLSHAVGRGRTNAKAVS